MRVGSGLVVTKVIAVTLGAAGLAMYSQAQNLLMMLAIWATSGLSNGVTRNVASTELNTDEALKRTIGAALLVAAFFATVLGAILLSVAEPIAMWLFGDANSVTIVRWVAISLPFACCAPIPLAALSGQRDSIRCIVAPMLVNIVAAAICILLVSRWGLQGAAVSIFFVQALTLFVNAIFFAQRNPNWNLAHWFKPDCSSFRVLIPFMLMALVGGVSSQISTIFVRTSLANQLGWELAGHWQAIVKISEIHVSAMTTALTIYYLPRLSRITTAANFKQLLRQALPLVVFGTTFSALAIHSMRHQVIALALSPQFGPISELLWLQLLGDFIKLISFVFAMVMWAKSMIRSYIFLEVASSLLFGSVAVWLIPGAGVAGPLIANLVMYVVYLIASVVVAFCYAPWRELGEVQKT